MFTGLIQNLGTVKEVRKNDDWRIVIETSMDLTRTEIGASICCSGCCLTVVEKTGAGFAVEVSQETLSKTTLSGWRAGQKINLEPSLKVGDELGGHFVFGHVDGLAEIVSILSVGDSYKMTCRVPDEFSAYLASKGSVALDGVSLTLNEVTGSLFCVNIIPHTWKHTTLQERQEGESFNFEADMLARYVAARIST